MDPQAIYRYFADRLKTNISLIHPKEKTSLVTHVEDPFIEERFFVEEMIAATSQEKPIICSVNDEYYFGTVLFHQGALIIGPVFSSGNVQLGNGLRFTVHIKEQPKIPEGSLFELVEAVQVIQNFWNDTDLSFDRILYQNFYHKQLGDMVNNRINDILFEYNETNETHGSYDIERRLVHAIKSGNMKMVMESTQENVYGKHGVVDDDALENAKKLSIVGITIASRAAIEGGLPFEIALSLTDSYFYQLNEAKNMSEVSTIVFQCNEHLTRLVSERKARDEERENDTSARFYSEKAKDYVQSHLHDAITVQEIANELAISPNYLSALFRRYEGISLTRYILKEKVSLASNMLLYSTMGYSDIAMYLGFSSQSHFCKVFKQITSISPSEYRKRLT